MIAAEATTTIARPVHEVFAYVADPGNASQWDRNVIKARNVSPGPLQRGSLIEVAVRSAGRRSVRFEVVDLEPGRRIRLRAAAATIPFLPDVEYRFEPAGRSTIFTRRVEIRPTGLLRVVGPLFVLVVRSGNARHVAAIKKKLELAEAR